MMAEKPEATTLQPPLVYQAEKPPSIVKLAPVINGRTVLCHSQSPSRSRAVTMATLPVSFFVDVLVVIRMLRCWSGPPFGYTASDIVFK